MKLLRSLIAVAALLAFAPVAANASVIPYFNSPVDTVQAALNTVVANTNSAAPSVFSTNGSATASSGAATLSTYKGQITSEALTTAAAATYTLTLTNTNISATSIVLVSVGNGTNTTVGPSLAGVTPGAGSATIVVRNTHASSALNGTIVINYVVFN